MASLDAVLHDPRRRNLVILAAVAVAMVALAAVSLTHQAALVAPKYTPRSFFPNLAQQSQEVARIHIESKKYGDVDVAFRPVTGWVLPDHHDYPADYDQVKKTLVGMGALETIQPQTAREDWLHYLHLGAPGNGGEGTKIVLLNDKDQVIAQMIAGKRRDIGDVSGAFGLFARKPDSTQSWLLRSVFIPSANPKSWMNRQVIGIDRARIQEVEVSPPHGPSYTVRRDKPSDPDFKLVHMPRGRTLSYSSAPNGVAAALVDFTFDDVSPAREFDFAHGAGLVTKTFDGLSISARIVKTGGAYWVTLSATALKPSAKGEAQKINKAADGWAFQVPAYKGSQFTSPLETLLAPRRKK